ncbi:MAG: hypothetical protein CML06_02350 [Pseudomonadales bacterium]|nr:hypothetical protein [Pseudomonadales bacterium]
MSINTSVTVAVCDMLMRTFSITTTFPVMANFDESDPPFESDIPSKSAIKREAERLKQMGERLLAMNAAELAGLELGERLQLALEEGRRIKSREGLRRHKQFIGKLLREQDTSAIEARLAQIDSAHSLNTQAFQALEHTREQLIGGDNDSIGAVIARHPQVDKQKLRQLVRNARKEREAQSGTRHARALFRFLRELELNDPA